jgi:hypothetical protein
MHPGALPDQQDGGIGNAYARAAVLAKIVEFCCLLHGTGHVALPVTRSSAFSKKRAVEREHQAMREGFVLSFSCAR